MTSHDEDLGFPGNREIVERQLAVATTQVLYLATETTNRAGHRSLVERGAELVCGMETVPAQERFWTAPPVTDALKDPFETLNALEDPFRAWSPACGSPVPMLAASGQAPRRAP